MSSSKIAERLSNLVQLLMTEIRFLRETQPRYKPYDKVWVMRNNTPTELQVFAVIESMDYWKRGSEYHYRLVESPYGVGWGNHEGVRYAAAAVYASREELILSLQEKQP